MPDGVVLRSLDLAAVGCLLAEDQAQKGGLAAAVATDQAQALAGRQRHGHLIEEDPRAVGLAELLDLKHLWGGDSSEEGRKYAAGSVAS
jgi:hypothetical protein